MKISTSMDHEQKHTTINHILPWFCWFSYNVCFDKYFGAEKVCTRHIHLM